LELDLTTTYCRRTLETEGSIALHDATDQGWDDDPAFETHGLQCYHGTSIYLDGEPYGTVCFVATDARREFSHGDTMFAELIARLPERELERERHEAQFARQTNLATVLNRVLRHNLRNDMSVILGFTQHMADQLDDSSYGRTALSNIDDLLDLCQKTRELDRIVAGGLRTRIH
jgi:GAF domain-containing protein